MNTDQNITMRPRMAVRLRPFRDEDYPRHAEIGTLSFPDEPWSVEEIRHADAAWDRTRYEFLRMVAEDAGGRIAGTGRINHEPWNPDRRGGPTRDQHTLLAGRRHAPRAHWDTHPGLRSITWGP